jgi:CBS domain containing-hemolysin-like protein
MKPERTRNCNLHLLMTTKDLNQSEPTHQPKTWFSSPRWASGALLPLLMLLPSSARASMFKGETLDKAADVLTWVVLIVAPLVGITVFLLVHILPEKIAEKKQHPQAGAIQCLCLLSLVFGGVLWPLAWLWASTKPVLYRMAYGTDKVAHGTADTGHPPPDNKDEAEELKRLRQRVVELETKLEGPSATEGGKA